MNLRHFRLLRLLLVTRYRQAYAALSALLARRWKERFYLYLAGLFTWFVVADAVFLHLTTEMRQAAFDAMVRYRIVKPQPDPDIVIVDINEASLAAMAREYGRWPWPRQVLGEFLEQIEKQQPRAVVFDILFSDADVYNPDSDAYFDAAIAATGNTYFPILRLDPDSDALSQLYPGMIPGVEATPQAKPDATVALVLPHFQAALAGGRLGLHNIYPDADGVARQYLVYRDDYGWKLPSLPARLARELGWPPPQAQRVLLNWRGAPFSYRYVGFAEVFADFGSKEKRRAQDEFKGKIVIIGSTAPSLFDIKPTPMSRMHPGVEILATAIDNMKHGDYLRFPEARVPYTLLTLLIVWLTAWGFYRDIGRSKMDRLFGASQFILLGISYASINFTTIYINLTGPVSVAIAFFTLARLYAAATGKALEQSSVRTSLERHGELQATLLLIRLDAPLLSEAALEKIRAGLQRSGSEAKSVEALKGRQRGLWDLLGNTLAVSWVAPAQEQGAEERFARDAGVVLGALPGLLRRYLVNPDNVVSWFMHHSRISGGNAARTGWRMLLCETLLQWEQQKKEIP
ncbi:MAG: CHASE2 domain-containing protein [Pseudomonadota bacterium]